LDVAAAGVKRKRKIGNVDGYLDDEEGGRVVGIETWGGMYPAVGSAGEGGSDDESGEDAGFQREREGVGHFVDWKGLC